MVESWSILFCFDSLKGIRKRLRTNMCVFPCVSSFFQCSPLPRWAAPPPCFSSTLGFSAAPRERERRGPGEKGEASHSKCVRSGGALQRGFFPTRSTHREVSELHRSLRAAQVAPRSFEHGRESQLLGPSRNERRPTPSAEELKRSERLTAVQEGVP